jgi:hypothetical protein
MTGEATTGDGAPPGPVSGAVREPSEHLRVESLALSHVSVELGHLYFEDFAAGPDALSASFAALVPWAEAAVSRTVAGEPSGRARISTCFLVDDYFSRFAGPAEVVPMVLEAAAKSGLQVDYLARESACAVAGEARPAELLLARLVIEPSPGTTGARPPLTETGWLTNGVRSPAGPGSAPEAMAGNVRWQPPRQNSARRHSIFIDVELWDDGPSGRVWSCAMLAAVWQVLRLGLLRDLGRPVAQPVDAPAQLPEDWRDFPPVVRLRPRAEPFAAYTTVSLLPSTFLPVELAVRTILGQFAADPQVLEQVARRAGGENIRLAEEIIDRISYAFSGAGRGDPA